MHGRIALALAVAAAVLTACASRDATLPESPAPAAPGGALAVRVKLPLHPRDVSPATQGIRIRTTGPTTLHEDAGLRLTARGCRSKVVTLSCELQLQHLRPCPNKKPCYKLTVATYDAFDAATNSIPRNAHELAAEQKVPFTIAAGKTTLVPLALDGIPRSIDFLPASNSTLEGSQTAGYVEPKCAASAQTVDVVGADADGNLLVGTGAPHIALSSGDAQQLSVASAPGDPSEFTLSPPSAPAYAFGNHTIVLTMTATPGKTSGAARITSTVDVAFSGDICGIFTEFAVPTAGAEPVGIAPASDGNVWFTEFGGNKLGRITTDGAFTEYPLPASTAPFAIVGGPDGNLWFAENSGNAIGKADTGGTLLGQYPVSAGGAPIDVTDGPDGNVWFTENAGERVGKVTTAGVLTEYADPTTATVFGIATGPDGNLWYTDVSPHIGRVTTSGSITEWALAAGVGPIAIAAGPNGTMWFSECKANLVAEITTDGTIPARWALPEPSSGPFGIVEGPDQAIWVAESVGNRIARIAASGTISEFAIPTVASQPLYLTVGPDGAIWFTELAGDKIGRLR